MTFVIKQSLRFVLTMLFLVFVGCLPSLFQGIHINLSSYISQIENIFSQLLHPRHLVYPYQGMTLPLFPDILTPYLYSMKIFFSSLVFSFLIALIFTYLTCFLPKSVQKVILFFVFLGQSLPDIFVIVIFQVMMIVIFQTTGILLMNIAEGFNEQIYLLPVLCLSFLPTCFFYRMMMIAVKEELNTEYYYLAKSKGLTSDQILFKHILRNITLPLATYSKTIIWMLLSNLVILEYMFGMHGMTLFINNHPTSLVLTISLFLIFIPIFVFNTVVTIFIRKVTGQKVVI